MSTSKARYMANLRPDTAPATLNTLNELAAAIGDDDDYAAAVTTALGGKLALVGGTMSGNIVMGDDTSIGIGDSAERIEFDGAGDISLLGCNVGIGTDAPAYLFSVEGDRASNGTTDIAEFSSGSGSNNGTLRISTDYNSTAATRPVRLQSIDQQDQVAPLSLNPSGGNVGIGNSSPAAKLEIQGVSGTNPVTIIKGAVQDTVSE